LAVVLEDV